jgi:uncharacterized protein
VELLGWITFTLLLLLVCSCLVIGGLALFSIGRRRFYFVGLLSSGFLTLETLLKAIFRLVGSNGKQFTHFFVRLHNSLALRSFQETPVGTRAVFFPQCLRSALCPARLGPEGLECRKCGRCRLNDVISELEGLGYKVFIVPGSSFVKRMVRQHRPQAIIGIGCLIEIKEGLQMCDQIGLVGMGVVQSSDGCIETTLNWHELHRIARLGLEVQEERGRGARMAAPLGES